MIDLDHGPTVFALWIVVAAGFPVIYGTFFIDAYWEKHQSEEADDAFN